MEMAWAGVRGVALRTWRKSARLAAAASDTVKYSGPGSRPMGAWYVMGRVTSTPPSPASDTVRVTSSPGRTERRDRVMPSTASDRFCSKTSRLMETLFKARDLKPLCITKAAGTAALADACPDAPVSMA